MMGPESTTEVSLNDGETDPMDPPTLPQTGPSSGGGDDQDPGSTDGDGPGPSSSRPTREGGPSISFHPAWFKTLSGQLVCLEVAFSLLAFISIVAGPTGPAYWFFAIIAFFSFLWMAFVLFVHLLQLYRMVPALPWMAIELVVSLAYVILWFIADLILLANLYYASSGAAIMCGLFAFLSFCGSAYIGFTEYLEQIRKQGTPLPSAIKRANKAEGGGGGDEGAGDEESNSEDSLSEMPTVNPI